VMPHMMLMAPSTKTNLVMNVPHVLIACFP